MTGVGWGVGVGVGVGALFHSQLYLTAVLATVCCEDTTPSDTVSNDRK